MILENLRSFRSGLTTLVIPVVVVFACLPAVRAIRAQDADSPLAPYAKASGEVAGSLKCVGSDTMNNLVALWVEGFKKSYPGVREGIEGKGSASAPPARSAYIRCAAAASSAALAAPQMARKRLGSFFMTASNSTSASFGWVFSSSM